MPSVSVWRFLRGRREAHQSWREQCDRKDVELSNSLRRVFLRGTEESETAHMDRLQENRDHCRKIIRARLRDQEDIGVLVEQNRQWLIEAERQQIRIQERIDRAHMRRVANPRARRYNVWG